MTQLFPFFSQTAWFRKIRFFFPGVCASPIICNFPLEEWMTENLWHATSHFHTRWMIFCIFNSTSGCRGNNRSKNKAIFASNYKKIYIALASLQNLFWDAEVGGKSSNTLKFRLSWTIHEFDGEVLANRCSRMGNKKVQEEENCQITGQKRQKSHVCLVLQEMMQSHISLNYNQLQL